MTIGTLIKTIRTIRGVSQKDLSEAVGVSTNFLCLVENGKRNLSQANIEKIAESLCVSREALEFICMDVPKELDETSSERYRKLQDDIASLLIFQGRKSA